MREIEDETDGQTVVRAGLERYLSAGGTTPDDN